MSDLLLIGCIAALGAAVGIAAVLLADRVSDFFGFYRKQFSRNAEIEMADMFIFANGRQLFILNLMLLVLIPLFLHVLFQILVLTIAGAIVALFVPRLILKQMTKARLQKFEEQLPDAFMLLSSSLQSGASLNMALENVVQQSPAPLSQEFGLLIKNIRLGVTLEDALLKLEKRIPLPSFIMASSAIRISREVGGNLVETINGMAAMLRRPVFFMSGVYLGGNRYELHFELLADFSTTDRNERDAAMAQAMQAYADRLGDFCRRAPYNWFNFFDFWQRT